MVKNELLYVYECAVWSRRTGAHATNDTNPKAARDSTQQTTPCAWYVANLLKIILDGYSLPYAKHNHVVRKQTSRLNARLKTHTFTASRKSPQ